MEPPKDEKQFQSFLGMVNFFKRFSPRLANLTAPLRALLKRDAEFSWGPEFQRAFEDTKAEIGKVTSLQFYDPAKPLIVQVDASGTGLDAARIQENGPTAFASKSLSGGEREDNVLLRLSALRPYRQTDNHISCQPCDEER